MWNERRRRWSTALVVAGMSALAVGVPTDVIDTPFFTRMTPVRWWEYPVLVLTAVLTAAWVAIPRPSGDVRGRGGVVGSVTVRSEEHTSELQSRRDLVCRLLLEKK